MRVRLFGILVAVMLAIGIGHAQGGTGTIVLNQTNPSLGDFVSFTTTSDVPKKYADAMNVQVLCYQNGSLVFATSGRADRSFQLGGTPSSDPVNHPEDQSPWRQVGGPATCHADLYYWTTSLHMVIVASTSFDAAG